MHLHPQIQIPNAFPGGCSKVRIEVKGIPRFTLLMWEHTKKNAEAETLQIEVT